MATFRKRGPYQWEARIRKRGYPTTCKTFENKADAEAWAKEVESDMYKNLFVPSKEAEQYTLGECLDRYIEEHVPRLKHPKREEYRARFLQRYPISHRIMATIRSKDIADFRRQREEEGCSGNTIRLDFAMLSKLFNYARSDWGMESLQNPVQLAAKPRPGKARERRLEDGEEKKILESAKSPFDDIIRFALETAMRREEIARMEWKHVNLRARSVFLPETKNAEARTVPLSPIALEILKTLPKHEGSELVFGVDKEKITYAMKDIRKETGIEDLRFHDLRHEATSRFFENTDLDVMEIKAITGHKTLQMLARYTHLRTARLADRLAGGRRGS